MEEFEVVGWVGWGWDIHGPVPVGVVRKRRELPGLDHPIARIRVANTARKEGQAMRKGKRLTFVTRRPIAKVKPKAPVRRRYPGMPRC